MVNRIGTGYHTCIDYELNWDYEIFRNLIIKHQINDLDIKLNPSVSSIKDLLINCLYYMKEGRGGEIIPIDYALCDDFASNFEYEITIGGTATRASIAISKLKIPNSVFMCCYNKYFEERMPKLVDCNHLSVNGYEKVYPHVILQYPKGLDFKANDISFTTNNRNRIMISNDLDSTNMKIPLIQAEQLEQTEVFLMSCFSEVLESKILEEILIKVEENAKKIKSSAWVVLEDGHYVIDDFKSVVHKSLNQYADILSMNEEELQDVYKKKIDILNVKEVSEAIKFVHKKTGFDTLIIHSKYWALVYGKNANIIKPALKFGIGMASTRFKYGDNFGSKEFDEILNHNFENGSSEFCKELESFLKGKVGCEPSFDLDYVKNPTIVGLGDFFAGGLLIGLMNNPKVK